MLLARHGIDLDRSSVASISIDVCRGSLLWPW